MKVFVLFCCLFCSGAVSAQLFVDSLQYTAEELVMDFFDGSCIDVIAVEYTGQAKQKTFFEGSQSGLGVNAGIILTTGDAGIAVGPNNSADASAGYGTHFPADASPFSQFVQSAVGLGANFDWSLLHITFVPNTDSIGFKYVFASEEYCEFVGTQFNDVFGFLISGPGITGVQNIALLPNSLTPVAINEVNHLQNSAFYRNNIGDTSTVNQNLCGQPISTDPMHQWVQYDGTTTLLTASAIVVPGETYDVWIGISDIGDGIWDSGIFLSIESLCGDSLLHPVANFSTQVNGNSVAFQNATKYATAWDWDFGDGNTSSERFPTHLYDNLNQQYTVQLVASNYCCSDTTVTLVGTSGVARELTAADFQVYPTQFKDVLNLVPPQLNSRGQLVLYDLAGQAVLNRAFGGRSTINTAHLPSGMYFLEIQTDNKHRFFKKLVK